ncbi:hypothetical protein CYMTET_33262, partial [Cymbomonas tetramitiformis]
SGPLRCPSARFVLDGCGSRAFPLRAATSWEWARCSDFPPFCTAEAAVMAYTPAIDIQELHALYHVRGRRLRLRTSHSHGLGMRDAVPIQHVPIS